MTWIVQLESLARRVEALEERRAIQSIINTMQERGISGNI